MSSGFSLIPIIDSPLSKQTGRMKSYVGNFLILCIYYCCCLCMYIVLLQSCPTMKTLRVAARQQLISGWSPAGSHEIRLEQLQYYMALEHCTFEFNGIELIRLRFLTMLPNLRSFGAILHLNGNLYWLFFQLVSLLWTSNKCLQIHGPPEKDQRLSVVITPSRMGRLLSNFNAIFYD